MSNIVLEEVFCNVGKMVILCTYPLQLYPRRSYVKTIPEIELGDFETYKSYIALEKITDT